MYNKGLADLRSDDTETANTSSFEHPLLRLVYLAVCHTQFKMASSLSAAKQQLRSLVKQRLAAVPADSIVTQSKTVSLSQYSPTHRAHTSQAARYANH